MTKEYVMNEYKTIVSEIKTAATGNIKFDRLRDLRKLEEFIISMYGSSFLNELRTANGLETY